MTEARPEPRASRRSRRLPRVAVITVVVIVVLLAVASRINLHYFVLSPGDAQSVGPLIKVPADRAHRTHGSVLLTDVFVNSVSALQYLPDLLSGENELVPASALVQPGEPASEFTAQGYLEMAQSQSAAKTAALRRLGYSVSERDSGAVIEGVASGFPASAQLKVAQVVTAVNGVPTPTGCAFVRQLTTLHPGQRVALSVETNHFSADGTPVRGSAVTETVRLVKRPAGVPAETECGVPPSKGFLGLSVGTQQDFAYPFPITINTAGIGGPSAGLAMTLGLLNTLSGGHLTGGRIIAATGTIDPSGDVGDVGGVAQKTIAVERAGATVFFVPPPELAIARSKATPTLQVFAVSTLAQALSVLQRMGGHVPPAASPG
jgi:PDZ domain-containing protein